MRGSADIFKEVSDRYKEEDNESQRMIDQKINL